jgi:AbrB family looped-hinge helix DNA binding protein
MTKKQGACCSEESACRVESILSIDERGQMVLPKDLRTRAGISPGERLAVVSHEMNGEVCCITLIKAESLNQMVKGVLGPVMRDMINE